eukprot:gene12597-8635_t
MVNITAFTPHTDTNRTQPPKQHQNRSHSCRLCRKGSSTTTLRAAPWATTAAASTSTTGGGAPPVLLSIPVNAFYSAGNASSSLTPPSSAAAGPSIVVPLFNFYKKLEEERSGLFPSQGTVADPPLSHRAALDDDDAAAAAPSFRLTPSPRRATSSRRFSTRASRAAHRRVRSALLAPTSPPSAPHQHEHGEPPRRVPTTKCPSLALGPPLPAVCTVPLHHFLGAGVSLTANGAPEVVVDQLRRNAGVGGRGASSSLSQQQQQQFIHVTDTHWYVTHTVSRPSTSTPAPVLASSSMRQTPQQQQQQQLVSVEMVEAFPLTAVLRVALYTHTLPLPAQPQTSRTTFLEFRMSRTRSRRFSPSTGVVLRLAAFAKESQALCVLHALRQSTSFHGDYCIASPERDHCEGSHDESAARSTSGSRLSSLCPSRGPSASSSPPADNRKGRTCKGDLATQVRSPPKGEPQERKGKEEHGTTAVDPVCRVVSTKGPAAAVEKAKQQTMMPAPQRHSIAATSSSNSLTPSSAGRRRAPRKRTEKQKKATAQAKQSRRSLSRLERVLLDLEQKDHKEEEEEEHQQQHEVVEEAGEGAGAGWSSPVATGPSSSLSSPPCSSTIMRPPSSRRSASSSSSSSSFPLAMETSMASSSSPGVMEAIAAWRRCNRAASSPAPHRRGQDQGKQESLNTTAKKQYRGGVRQQPRHHPLVRRAEEDDHHHTKLTSAADPISAWAAERVQLYCAVQQQCARIAALRGALGITLQEENKSGDDGGGQRASVREGGGVSEQDVCTDMEQKRKITGGRSTAAACTTRHESNAPTIRSTTPSSLLPGLLQSSSTLPCASSNIPSPPSPLQPQPSEHRHDASAALAPAVHSQAIPTSEELRWAHICTLGHAGPVQAHPYSE